MIPRRAQAGGETVGGQFFKGGQFVTKEALQIEAGVVPGSFEKGMREVKERTQKAAFENLRHAAASIRKDVSRSITQKKDHSVASPPGEPPIQHKPGFFKRALRYVYSKEVPEALVGFERSKVGDVAATHEHGLREEGRDYPERPMVGPGLERNIGRMAPDWRASI